MISLKIINSKKEEFNAKNITKMKISMQKKIKSGNTVVSDWHQANLDSGINTFRIKYNAIFDGNYGFIYNTFLQTCEYEFTIIHRGFISKITADCKVEFYEHLFESNNLISFFVNLISSGNPTVETHKHTVG